MDQTDNIKTALSRVQVPILLARKTTDAGRHVLTVHTTEKTARRAILERIENALAVDRIELTTRIKVHRPRTLQRYRSLETLNQRFGDGERRLEDLPHPTPTILLTRFPQSSGFHPETE